MQAIYGNIRRFARQRQLFAAAAARSGKTLLILLFAFALTRVTPSGAAEPDCNIYWYEVLHDTFDSAYRLPAGAVSRGTTVRLRLRVADNDLTAVRLRADNQRTQETFVLDMTHDPGAGPAPDLYDYWIVDFNVGSQPAIYYYAFELIDDGHGACSPADQDWYGDDDPATYGGGTGRMYESWPAAQRFQITVYDPDTRPPDWLHGAVIYHIFPDRFRDGDSDNNTPPGSFFYGGYTTIFRSNTSAWNTVICEPSAAGPCYGHWGDHFYGGDLAGILDKLRAGYFAFTGVTVLYLNPIFQSPSNHCYDTMDFFHINQAFGDELLFAELAAEARRQNIRIILDAVFNHCATDSCYFDMYRRFDSSCALAEPPWPGANDGSGGCEASSSPYHPWFYFGQGTCPGCPDPYMGWTTFCTLPKFRSDLPAVRNFFYAGGLSAVAPYWIDAGAAGWRLDVADEVDPGLGSGAGNGYWQGLRAAVRQTDPEAGIIGEFWGDASPWLLGPEWDSAMNYRLRAALLGWLFTGCSGNGCTNGSSFRDEDMTITPVTPTQFDARLMAIWEDYPPFAFTTMMNIAGSHDTNRLRFLLRKINWDNDQTARQRMKEAWLFLFTYAGAPTLYYGDEIGLCQDGVWKEGTWKDNPYNRAPFPWDDTPGDFVADASLQQVARKLISIHQCSPVFSQGETHHGLVIDDARQLYGYARTAAGQTALIVLNRGDQQQQVTLTGLNESPFNLTDGTELLELTTGARYQVSGQGQLAFPVPSSWGAVLLDPATADIPSAPADLRVQLASGGAELSWEAVRTDTTGGSELPWRYRIHRDLDPGFEPSAANLLAELEPPPFGSADGRISFYDAEGGSANFTYVVCARNPAGRESCCRSGGSHTPAPTATPTNSPAPTFTPTPNASPPATATPPDWPSPTPVPAASQTHLPTPRPTPDDCQTTGVAIEMPASDYRPGDICYCRALVCNAEGSTLIGYPLFVLLEVAGVYYFGPGFGEGQLDHYLARTGDLPPGLTVVPVIDAFSWPHGAGAASGIVWYAALTDPEVTWILGQLGTFSFGFSED